MKRATERSGEQQYAKQRQTNKNVPN